MGDKKTIYVVGDKYILKEEILSTQVIKKDSEVTISYLSRGGDVDVMVEDNSGYRCWTSTENLKKII